MGILQWVSWEQIQRDRHVEVEQYYTQEYTCNVVRKARLSRMKSKLKQSWSGSLRPILQGALELGWPCSLTSFKTRLCPSAPARHWPHSSWAKQFLVAEGNFQWGVQLWAISGPCCQQFLGLVLLTWRRDLEKILQHCPHIKIFHCR